MQTPLYFSQKLRQELLSRQGSVEATRDSVSKLLQSSEASKASGLQAALNDLTQRYTAAQASQAEREADLKGLLPRLENYERLGADLQVFTQSRQKALSPAGQPDRAVDDYRQTIEVGSQDINSIFLLSLLVQFQFSLIFPKHCSSPSLTGNPIRVGAGSGPAQILLQPWHAAQPIRSIQ